MSKWYEGTEYSGSNVIYSRIRLSRNWAEHPFPSRMSQEERQKAAEVLADGIRDYTGEDGKGWYYRDLSQIGDLERQSLRERRILNAAASGQKEPGGLLLTEDESRSMILCGDDHMRLQLLGEGLRLEELWRQPHHLYSKSQKGDREQLPGGGAL